MLNTLLLLSYVSAQCRFWRFSRRRRRRRRLP